ncbi:hypothetical protein AVEN_242563-1 [Araneus ventricosus]|uniref:Uncharacterized protein n=1 Tax=Araneus ventricosus TaxID=182803 RepID=A0A4Y2UQM4_ARAVE|nr:hypothetical protein AVEN_242563-1 [Araneus ventricosus]
MLEAMEVDDICTRLVSSYEATFHLSGKVNRHNVRIWDLANPHTWIQNERDSPKVNVFCAMSVSKIYGPFFFAEKTVTGSTYLDMLEIWLFRPDKGRSLQLRLPTRWGTTPLGYRGSSFP